HSTAFPVTHPTKFWQEDSAIALIELDLLRIRETECIAASFALISGICGTSREEILECLVQMP
ncbi:hypothetical protein, partial [Pseudoduganella sp. OTU4001]|uniref:hypothetical protein n=1 Tax=Pseudoduganella sp. OTU4001 TaxID=3043854 RepID=UPI00313CC823